MCAEFALKGGEMDPSGFMHQYYDWNAFERFIKELHAADGDVIVQHNVTEVDRHGAKRQIDVKIVRKSSLYTFTTLVECKRWKEPVGRDRVDVLAASLEGLAAHHGAIFTTTGFEEGAVAYARSKGIELYLVRDLSDQEWGLPGRHLHFHVHLAAAELRHVQFAATAIPLIDELEPDLELHIDLRPEKALDPQFDLFSTRTGERGTSLVSLLGEAHRLFLSCVSQLKPARDWSQRGILQLSARAELDLTSTPFCQLRLQKAAVRIERVGFEFITHINRSEISVDRGANLDFAVMVESFVSEQRLIAQRGKQDSRVHMHVHEADASTEAPLENGSIFRMDCSPWTGLGTGVPAERMSIGELLRAVVSPDAALPGLILKVGSDLHTSR